MDKKIRVGVFGAARGMTMINVLAKHPDAQLVAVCDKYTPLLDGVRKKAGEHHLETALYEDFEEFFAHDMDAVVLANYANEHAPYAVRLLQSGRHVMSEVLPCETMAQAVELIEAAEASGKVYAYAENYCYMKGPFEMWQRYAAGDIGEVQYAEGEYIHDCSSILPRITYGQRDHWRNRMYSTFYCTHSLGPPLAITGRRPVQVVGFETNMNLEGLEKTAHSVLCGCGGIEMVTLDNGAVVKSVHGWLKREPSSYNYQVYGTKGMLETDRWDGNKMSAYIEGEKLCKGELTHYAPEAFSAGELARQTGGHGGSDYYTTHFFLEKILGRPDGDRFSIDVYKAVDMGICGILAYRSVLNGNVPVRVPDLRNQAQRELYRNDHACTNPAVAGAQLLPVTPQLDISQTPEEAYEKIRTLWLEGKDLE